MELFPFNVCYSFIWNHSWPTAIQQSMHMIPWGIDFHLCILGHHFTLVSLFFFFSFPLFLAYMYTYIRRVFFFLITYHIMAPFACVYIIGRVHISILFQVTISILLCFMKYALSQLWFDPDSFFITGGFTPVHYFYVYIPFQFNPFFEKPYIRFSKKRELYHK